MFLAIFYKDQKNKFTKFSFKVSNFSEDTFLSTFLTLDV